MLNSLLILFGKTFAKLSLLFNLGNGSTWPGYLALQINPHFIQDILSKSQTKIVLITGSNGKTTTGKMITTILQTKKCKVFQNTSGANLINGIASSILLHSSILLTLNYDYVIFEVDENILPVLLQKLTPFAVIILNLFRDQLDRYGETDAIIKKWSAAFADLNSKTLLILNADDPQIAYLGNITQAKVAYFGLKPGKMPQTKLEHAVDSIYCPRCNNKLTYLKIAYSHLGKWKCLKCKLHQPQVNLDSVSFYPLLGTYNEYNTHAAVLLGIQLGIDTQTITAAMRKLTPAFGRQEKLNIAGKSIQIFLAKNPTSFNQSLATIASLKAKTVLLVLNDRIPDGTDISWIWDVDFENYLAQFKQIIISGDRCYDLGLRMKYAFPCHSELNSESRFQNKILPVKLRFGMTFSIEKDLKQAIGMALAKTAKTETLYILPTYSAMLEARQILTGKAIL